MNVRRTKNSTLSILSAGAPKTAVRLCAEAYSNAAGHPTSLKFATAPKIREIIACGTERPDIVVAPDHLIREFMANGAAVERSIVALGSIEVGVAVQSGSQKLDISSVQAFRNALLNADTLVFNTASSGRYVAHTIEQLELTEAVAQKVVQPSTGAGVMKHLAEKCSERSIGFGQKTEIKLHEGLGIRLAGSLPDKLNRKTEYCAVILETARNYSAAQDLLSIVSSATGRRILSDSGLASRPRF